MHLVLLAVFGAYLNLQPASAVSEYTPLCTISTNTTTVNWALGNAYPADIYACNVTAVDQAVFVWTGTHSVRRVNTLQSLQGCDTTSGVLLTPQYASPYYADFALLLGANFAYGGAIYLISDAPGDCAAGMKLVITVLGTYCKSYSTCEAMGNTQGNQSYALYHPSAGSQSILNPVTVSVAGLVVASIGL